MAWIELVIAGGLEVFWSTFMKLSEGFTKLWPTVWTGIGALGAVLVGILLLREPVTAPRLLFMALLLIGIIGLKITSAE